MKIKIQKNRIKYLLIAAVALVAIYAAYQQWFAPTKIALVNYTNAEVAAIAKAADNDFIKIVVVPEDDLSQLKHCDVLLINGMGLRINDEGRKIIEEQANSSKPLFVSAATNPANDFTNLDSSQVEQIINYMSGGDRNNMHELLNYLRRELDRKHFATHDLVPAKEVSMEVFVYPTENQTFSSVEEYNAFYKSKGLYKENAPSVVLLTAMLSPLSGNTEPIDELVFALQKRGMNVYPYAGMMNRLNILQEVNPDAVVNFAHGRLAMMQADAAAEWLKQQNIPVFAPLVMMTTYEEWLNDKKGMFGGFMSQSIVVPEIDGSILPYVFFTTKKDEDGLYPYKVIPNRLETFVDIVSKQIGLQSKSNADKKIAIFYFKGPGRSGLTAADMEVMPSLYNVLKRLKAEGYKVTNMPSSLEQFKKMIDAQGAVFEPYAEGILNEFIQNANPTLIASTEYESWTNKSLGKELYSQVVKKYGKAPGNFMAVSKDNKDYIAIARLDFGNIAILPQPLPAVGNNTFQIIHGANVAPPHSYIAPYLWTQHKFQADAIIHFGTHGSLEFTPGKSVALSNDDWSDRLIGNLPHFYIYAVSDVGEGMIAKRRSYSALLSHLTPPFMESETRSQFKELFSKINEYNKIEDTKSSSSNSISLAIKRHVVEMGLHRDLELDSNLTKPYSADEINKIENFAEEISSAKMTGNLYIMGVPYSQDKLKSTVQAMAAEPIAYTKAKIDELKAINKNNVGALHTTPPQNNKTTSAPPTDGNNSPSVKGVRGSNNKRNNAYFNSHYIVPANNLVNNILNGQKVTNSMLCSYAGISEKDLQDAINEQKEQQTMNNMSRMPANMTRGAVKSNTSTNKSKSGGGHPWWIPKIGAGPHKNSKKEDKSAEMTEQKGVMSQVERDRSQVERDRSQVERDRSQVERDRSQAERDRSQAERDRSHQSGRAYASKSGAGNSNNVGVQHIEPLHNQKYLQAILDLKQTIDNVTNYYNYLQQSPNNELNALINGLNGRYIVPSPGGDPVANPNILPTGRNMYSINVEATPTEASWENGKKLAEDLIADYKKRHNGQEPKRVNITLWSGAFIESEGAPIAQILYLLGVEPVRDVMGRVTELSLIPLSKLKRSRIDVVVQTSGQLRDIAASRLFLINQAIELAANAGDDGQYVNNVARTTADAEKSLIAKGLSPQEAKRAAKHRIFGGLNGMYGTGITGMVQQSDKWENQSQLAENYINNMGASYDSPDNWGEAEKNTFRAMLENTDAVVHSRQSNVWGALSLDHVYEFMGGVNLAVREVTGKDPDAYFSDLRNHHNPRIQELKEAVGVESRTTILNPAYIKEQMKGGGSAAGTFTSTFENMFGWEVMKPELIDNEMWDNLHNVYVKDVNNLGIKQFFETQNPYALQEMLAVMMETSRKGYWKATPEQLKEIASLHTELVEKHGSSGTGKTASNKLMQAEMVKYITPQQKQNYETALNATNEIQKSNNNSKSVVLKKDEQTNNQSSSIESGNSFSPLLTLALVGGILLVAIVAFVLARKKKLKNNE